MLTRVASSRFRLFFGILGILTVLLCLLADTLALVTNGVSDSIFSEVVAISHQSGTQWVVFLCVAINQPIFLLLECRIGGLRFWRAANPALWLSGVLFLGTLAYVLNYSYAVKSTQPLILLAAATLGSGAAAWSIERQSCCHAGSVGRLIVATLLVSLVVASLWPPQWGPTFALRGYTRWTGPWDNPNIYGLLMGVGVVLAIGSAVLNFKLSAVSPPDAGSWKGRRSWRKVIVAVLCFVSACLMGRGILHSYSRGAWCGTIVGLAYLTVQLGRGHRVKSGRWIRANGFSLAVATISILTLTFCHFRQTGWHPARRAFSMINTGDLSWRNRVAAWECALQIIAEHPSCGAGWNRPERLYRNYYFAPEVPERAIIGLNDYLLLGGTLGIPALACFGMYIWLCLRNRPQELKVENRVPEISSRMANSGLWTLDSLQVTCRAGAIVLLVGFWFDGGLFRLPTATTFWILIELGRRDLTIGDSR
jgi:hypothetical protein